MPSIIDNVPLVELNDGNNIPIIGFGTMGVDEDAVRIALNAGYRHFDCADFHQNEEAVGRALRKAIDEGNVKREDLFITSKVWPTWFGKGRPMRSATRILKSLEMDYLDLLLINWPTPFHQVDSTFWPVDDNDQCQFDESIEMIDVWKEFEEIKKAGLTRSIGVSNFNSRQIDDLIKNSSTVPAVNEVESHPFNNNSKLLKWMNERGIEMIAYSPLARAGMKDRKTPSPLEVPLLEYMAMSYNKTPADICLKWQTQRNVIAIPKSSTEHRIISNINIFDFWLSEKEIASIEDLNKDMRNFTWDVFGIDKHKNWPFKIPF